MVFNLLNTLQVKPEHAIVVGDSLLDLQMAKNANVHSLAVAYGSTGAGQWEKNGVRDIAHSINDLKNGLSTFLVPIPKKLNGIESVYWPTLTISDYWIFSISESTLEYDPFDDGMPREFPEPQRYEDLDDDDDLGEVVF